MTILYAQTDEQIQQVRQLFRDYHDFLGINLDFQDFEAELASLPGKYSPPDGALFIAVSDNRALGCGALRRFGLPESGICEMKRLYIRPEARNSGLGKQLALRIIEEAVRLGYSTMYLDTLDRLGEAMGLYRSLGFVETEAYYDNPEPDVVYWTLNLITTK